MRRPAGAKGRDATLRRSLALCMWVSTVLVALTDREGWVLLFVVAVILSLIGDE